MDADVIVIGAGQAGVPLATRLAAAGKRVPLAERGPVGGTGIRGLLMRLERYSLA